MGQKSAQFVQGLKTPGSVPRGISGEIQKIGRGLSKMEIDEANNAIMIN